MILLLILALGLLTMTILSALGYTADSRDNDFSVGHMIGWRHEDEYR